MSWVIQLIKRYGGLRPLEVCGGGGYCHVDFSVDDHQSTCALYVSKNHQTCLDFWEIIFFFMVLLFRILFTQLFLFKLLDQQISLTSGVLRQYQVAIFVFLRVEYTRLI